MIDASTYSFLIYVAKKRNRRGFKKMRKSISDTDIPSDLKMVSFASDFEQRGYRAIGWMVARAYGNWARVTAL